MIRGVIAAETGAIEHYTQIVEVTDQVDPVTNDMVIDILHDEQGHRRLFEGFLREYEAEGLRRHGAAAFIPCRPASSMSPPGADQLLDAGDVPL